MSLEKIAVIGAGSWGTALAHILSEKGHEIDLWVYESELCGIIKDQRENSHFLPGIKLSDKINPSNDIEQVVCNKSIIVLVLPTHVMRKVLVSFQHLIKPGCLIINASKGIENETLCTIDKIFKEVIKTSNSIATISGPTFAAEIARHCPSALVAAANDLTTAQRVQDIFSTKTIKVFTSTDLLGVELGGALKNIIAIATGISDGLSLGYNARAALITRGLVEIKRIGTAMGARAETFSGLSGMGDLVLTCTGDLSRNRSVGIKLAQGCKIKEIIDGMKMVAEGIYTVKSAYSLKQKLNIQTSIMDETYRVIYEEKPPKQALTDLMKVEISTEFTGVKGFE